MCMANKILSDEACHCCGSSPLGVVGMPLRLNELIVTAQSFYHLAPSHFEHSKQLRISSKSRNDLPIIRFFFGSQCQ